MPIGAKAPRKAAKKAVASKGAKKAAKKKAAPEAAPQVDRAAKAASERQIKDGPYAAIRRHRQSGLTPAKAMAKAAGER